MNKFSGIDLHSNNSVVVIRSCLAIISPELGKYQPKHRDSDDIFGGSCQDFDILCKPAEIA